MSFYMKPPRGLANVKNLEDTVRQRLICYDHLFSENIKNVILDLDCLAEDTVLDRLGHYLFRLVSLKSSRFCTTFINNEIKLLDIRFSCYRQGDIKYVLKKLKKHANESLQGIEVEGRLKQFYLLLIRLSAQLLGKEFLNHAFKPHDEICNQCIRLCFKVPFDFCLDLVASREYNIINGILYVYSFQWKNLFLSLYKTYILIVLKEMRTLPKVRLTLEDDRIKDVILLTKDLSLKGNSNKIGSKQGTFRIDSFSEEYKKFPPCMRHLYDILMKNNRLSHNARFDFSLYLKEIGLSMNDALLFWENAYSKQHASCSKCTHSWQDNEKRYIYGIRHLYGFEGSRRNYTVKSCQQMQNTSLTANEEGGCPFQQFDDEHLRKLLKSYLLPNSYDHIEVIIYERQQNSKAGCELFFNEYFNTVFQKNTEEKVLYHDPAQYYLLMNDVSAPATPSSSSSSSF